MLCVMSRNRVLSAERASADAAAVAACADVAALTESEPPYAGAPELESEEKSPAAESVCAVPADMGDPCLPIPATCDWTVEDRRPYGAE